MSAHTLTTSLAALAAVLVAVGVVQRSVLRPIKQTVGWFRERVEEWSETVEAVRDLIPLVAQLVVESDRRLTRLEALAGIPLEPLNPSRSPAEIAADLRARLRDPRTRTRREDQEPDHEAAS